MHAQVLKWSALTFAANLAFISLDATSAEPPPANVKPLQRIFRPALPPSAPTALPDLTLAPADLTTTPAVPAVGPDETGGVRIEARVFNRGGAEARNISVVFKLEGASVPGGERELTRTTLSVVPAGRSAVASVQLPANAIATGSYRLRALVDIYPSTIEESDESNNIAEIPLRVVGPDYAIQATDIELSPGRPLAGTPFTVTVAVRNQGAADARINLFWGLYDNTGRLVGEERWAWLGPIPASGFQVYDLPLTATSAGDYLFRVEADKAGRIPESDETNNRAEKVFKVLPR